MIVQDAPELDAGMRRQLAHLRDALASGMPRLGWKICVNEPRTQARLGLAAPFVGWLDATRLIASGGRYDVPPGAMLACEPEIAIRVGAPGDAAASDDVARPKDVAAPAETRAAIVEIAPALEVVDYARLSSDLAVIVETSSFHHGVVLGSGRPPAAAPAIGPDCPRLTRNGRPVGTPDPALVPTDLALMVQHVARSLAPYGETLRDGDWILSGACALPIRVALGDEIVADFGSLGAVRVSFEGPYDTHVGANLRCPGENRS